MSKKKIILILTAPIWKSCVMYTYNIQYISLTQNDYTLVGTYVGTNKTNCVIDSKVICLAYAHDISIDHNYNRAKQNSFGRNLLELLKIDHNYNQS